MPQNRQYTFVMKLKHNKVANRHKKKAERA